MNDEIFTKSRPLLQRPTSESSDADRMFTGKDNLIQQNEFLKNKIDNIEKQNLVQQKRLEHLEKLIIQLSSTQTPRYIVNSSSCEDNQDSKSIERSPKTSQSVDCGSSASKESPSYLKGSNELITSEDAVDFQNRSFQERHRISYPLESRRDEKCSGLPRHENQAIGNGKEIIDMDDVYSIMEEFDRTARENGLTYGVTGNSSVGVSEDMNDCVETTTERCLSPSSTVQGDDDCEIDILDKPATEFLTPSFRKQPVSATTSQCTKVALHMTSPQPSLITPVLLTQEALKAAEKVESNDNRCTQYGAWRSLLEHSFVKKSSRPVESTKGYKKKVNPFSNLLSGLNQISRSYNGFTNDCRSIVQRRIDRHLECSLGCERKYQPSDSPTPSSRSNISGHIRDWSRSLPLTHLSPLPESEYEETLCSISCRNVDESEHGETLCSISCRSVDGSISSHIRKWNKSQMLAYLSPLAESHYSYLEKSSEEEELVVDEVVSLSIERGSTSQPVDRRNVLQLMEKGCASASACAARNRQRTESVSSITGPCVPPDLLLDSGRHLVAQDESFDEVAEEHVLTEIAGILDGDLPLDEESVIIPDNELSAVQVKLEDGDLVLEEHDREILMKGEEGLQRIQNVAESVEGKDGNDEVLLNGGGFRNVTELMNKTSQSFISKEGDSSKDCNNGRIKVDEGNVKLKAGSIILAVVNESGSLVPLPQLPITSQKSTKNSKVEKSQEDSLEEEIDIETVTEKAPVLEAVDVDSLLAQFEASEAVNTPAQENEMSKSDKHCKSQLNNAANTTGCKTLTSSSLNSQSSSLPSPNHQKIKDALPKEIVEKIKASTKRKSTQMIEEPLIIWKGRGIRQQESNKQRNKGHRTSVAAAQQISGNHVPPPLDHDYCFSPEKQKARLSTEGLEANSLVNKLPDYYTGKLAKSTCKKVNKSDENHDDSGKKDSGVESGDVSDASVETEDRRKESSSNSYETKKDTTAVGKQDTPDIYNKLPPYMTDISNSKPKDDEEEDEDEKNDVEKKDDEELQIKKVKRKLNLSEYRQRIQSAHSSRCPSPTQVDTLVKTPDNNPLSLGDLIRKMKNAEEEQLKESIKSKVKTEIPDVVPSEEVEEGELKGDSEPEVSKSSFEENSKSEDPPKSALEKSTYSHSISSTDASTGMRGSRADKSEGYSSRRWSSCSCSRSRSRSRSPRKHQTSRYRRSRGKKRGSRRNSRSSISPYRCSRSRSRSYSRSRGKSSSGSDSYCSSCSSSDSSKSRSRSRSYKKWESRKSHSHRYSANKDRRRRSRSWSRSSSHYSSRSRRSRSPLWKKETSRSRSPSRRLMRPRRREDEDRLKQVEERRVIYVGRIEEGTSKAEIRRRFQKFGSIVDISVHFREHGDNYGFVTYKNKDEAYNAVEHGNDDPSHPRYELCFGGRRAFCRVQYSDLDAQDEASGYLGGPLPKSLGRPSSNVDFDSLLRAAMKRKTR